jgi:hypothetical protein
MDGKHNTAAIKPACWPPHGRDVTSRCEEHSPASLSGWRRSCNEPLVLLCDAHPSPLQHGTILPGSAALSVIAPLPPAACLLQLWRCSHSTAQRHSRWSLWRWWMRLVARRVSGQRKPLAGKEPTHASAAPSLHRSN